VQLSREKCFVGKECLFNSVMNDVHLKCTLTASPYRTVNTLRLGYKNQSVNVV
jgi:hypothetical protein